MHFVARSVAEKRVQSILRANTNLPHSKISRYEIFLFVNVLHFGLQVFLHNDLQQERCAMAHCAPGMPFAGRTGILSGNRLRILADSSVRFSRLNSCLKGRSSFFESAEAMGADFSRKWIETESCYGQKQQKAALVC